MFDDALNPAYRDARPRVDAQIVDDAVRPLTRPALRPKPPPGDVCMQHNAVPRA